jgi:uncharacterized protein YdhG (YjbR/CyaY superfamily)
MQKAPKDIDSYIELQPEKARGILESLRRIVKSAVPEAEELISYQMPAFRFHGMLVWFAAFKNHYTIFIPSYLHKDFPGEVDSFELTKSGAGIKLPFSQPVPADVLTRILKAKAKANLEKEQLKSG